MGLANRFGNAPLRSVMLGRQLGKNRMAGKPLAAFSLSNGRRLTSLRRSMTRDVSVSSRMWTQPRRAMRRSRRSLLSNK